MSELELPHLMGIVRTAENRTRTFEAIYEVTHRFPDRAEDEFRTALDDPTTSDRAKTILLLYLEHFGLFENLVLTYSEPLRAQMKLLAEDIDAAEEDGPAPFL